MVATVREVEEALVGVGVPEDRASRIAHAVDRAENAVTKEDLDHAVALMQASIRELRLELKLELEERIAGVEGRMTSLEGRMTVLEGRMTVLEGRIDDLEARLERMEQRVDAEALRNEQRHRQLMLTVVGIGASVLVMLAGIGVTALLRLFDVI